MIFSAFQGLHGGDDVNAFHNAEVLLRPGRAAESPTSARLVNPTNTMLDGDPALIVPADFMGVSFEASNVRGGFAR